VLTTNLGLKCLELLLGIMDSVDCIAIL